MHLQYIRQDKDTKSSCIWPTQKTRSLFAAYTLNLVRINRRALDVRSRARTRRNPRVLACLLQLWLEVLRGNHCQSCKAAGVNDLLSQDLEFVLG